MRYDVFVSYRWTEPDQSWVREHLVPALKRAGVQVCLDVEDFVPGRDLILEMSRAGSESKRALCVLSPDYFEGERMVGFESLMARRSDPTGVESRLIPFLLRPTQLPEWIRGLVPIDWTDPSHNRREWRKLLRVLDAGSLDAPAPAPIAAPSSEANVQAQPVLEQAQIRIVSLSKLVPREGEGVGYEISLQNDTDYDVFVRATEVSGEVAVVFNGAAQQCTRPHTRSCWTRPYWIRLGRAPVSSRLLSMIHQP